MGVSAQIVEDILGAPERRFAVDDPVPAEERAEEEEKALGEASGLSWPWKPSWPSAKACFRAATNLPRKTRAEPHREGEATTGSDPTGVIGENPPAATTQ